MSTSEIKTEATIGNTLEPVARQRYGSKARQSVHVSAHLRAGALRFYRDSTSGYGDRFPFPSHQTVRAGAQASPHERFLTFLAAGRAMGLSRHWFESQAIWVEAQIRLLCRDVTERDEWLEQRELEAENDCNVAELRYRLDRSPENRTRLIACLRAESARQDARASALEAEDMVPA